MNIKALIDSGIIVVRHYAPEILTVAGVGTMTFGAVKACQATPKAVLIMDQHKAERGLIDRCAAQAADNGGKVVDSEGVLVPYTENDHKKDIIQSNVNCVKQVAKKYALPVGLFLGGAAMVFGGQGLLRKDYATAVAGATALADRFWGYREAVIDRFGETVDKQLLIGDVATTVEVEKVDEKTGEVTTEVKTFHDLNLDSIPDNDPNLFLFSARTCGDLYTGSLIHDLTRIKCIQGMCQDRVDIYGHATNNFIREQFGCRGCDRGLFTGIVKTGERSHGKVDFGIFDEEGQPKHWVFEAIEKYNGIPIEIRDDGSIIGQLKNPRNARA